MHDQPTASELVAAVRAFIADHARPALSGHAAFHARVAENVLAIVERELAEGAAADAAARVRLLALLGEASNPSTETPPGASLDTLNTALSDRIRAGTMDERTPNLLAHLKATTIDQVRVDQPRYSGLKTAMNGAHD